MDYEQARQIVKAARTTSEAADAIAADIAWLLVGRLRKVNSGSILRSLKKEIANYDMTTGRWKP